MWTKEEEIKGGLRKLHSDNLRNVYCTTSQEGQGHTILT